MKSIIKSMIYSLFLALSLNIAPVIADGHGRDNAGNSQAGGNANDRGIEGRAHALELELWARQMGDNYQWLARSGTLRGIGTDFPRPTGRPSR